MIKGKVKGDLTIDGILKLVSPYDIYVKFMPHRDWKLNNVCISPFQRPGKGIERNPSFIISNKYGDIGHVDFGMSEYRGDCFAFVKQLHGLTTLDDVLRTIDKEFGLGISSGIVKDYKSEIAKNDKPQINKKSNLIQVITRKFTKEELSYWNEYYQDIADLRTNNVYSIKSLYLNKQIFHFKSTDLKFGYFYDGHWKIYRPFGIKKEKWFPNNVPITALDGKENIKDCEIAFITKSKKDMMVVKKVFSCSVGVQNEGMACFSQENVDYFKENSKKQVLGFDSDTTGVETSQQITKLFNFDYCNVPRKYLNEDIKDWAKLAHVYGLSEIEKVFKNKNLM
jgi:hypothetical protein